MHFIEDYPDRIRKAMRHSRRTQKDIAEAINMSRNSITWIMKGGTYPPLDKALIMADFLDVRWEWLLGGEGPMVGDVEETGDCQAKEQNPKYDTQRLDLAKKINSLSNYHKAIIEEIIESLSKMEKSE